MVFICENNGYGISVSQERHQNITDISQRAVSYNIPGITVDGNDVFAVHEAVNEAVARARKGLGPTLIECKTYRWRGHFEGDPTPYRTNEEVDQWKKKDPIPRVEAYILDNDVMTKDELDKLNSEIDTLVEEAVDFALESKYPDVSTAVLDVYTDIVEEGRSR